MPNRPSKEFLASLAKDRRLSMIQLLQELGIDFPFGFFDGVDLVIEKSGNKPGGGWSAEASAVAPNWSLALGVDRLQARLRDVKLRIEVDDGKAAVAFDGNLAVGPNALGLSWALPAPKGNLQLELRGSFPKLRLASLVKTFSPAFELPAQFDLGLDDNHATVIYRAGGPAELSVATKVAGAGSFTFDANTSGGRWRCDFSGDLEGVTVDRLPGLAALAPLVGVGGVKDARLVIRTYPASGAAWKVGFFVEGFLLPDRDRPLDALLRFVRLDRNRKALLEVSAPDVRTGSRAVVPFESVGVGVGRLEAGLVGLGLEGGKPSAVLEANWRLGVQGFFDAVTIPVGARVVSNGVLVWGRAEEGQSIAFSDLGVRIDGLAVSAGVSWEGVPSVGLTGRFQVRQLASTVAIFFDSADPSQSMLAAAVERISLREVAELIAGARSVPSEVGGALEHIRVEGKQAFELPVAVAADLDSIHLAGVAEALRPQVPGATAGALRVFTVQSGQAWRVTVLTEPPRHYAIRRSGNKLQVALQAQIYCAPNDTNIGGIDFKRGMQLAGRLDFLSVKADVEARLSTGKGVRAQVDLAPIVVGSAQFLQLAGAAGKGGPTLSIATYDDPSAPADRRAPHAFVSGAIQLLGVEVASAKLMGSKGGLVLRVEGGFPPLTSVLLDVTATSTSQASLEGRATVPVTLGAVDLGSLGKTVPFPAPVTVTLGIHGSVMGSTVSTSVTATFTALGLPITTPAIPLSVPLPNVASILVGPMSKALAGAINADKWLELIRNKFIPLSSFGPIAEVLVKHFGKSLGETVQLLGTLGATASDIAAALSKLTSRPDEALAAMLSAGYKLGTALASFQGFFAMTPELLVDGAKAVYQTAENLARHIGEELVDTLRDVYELDAERVGRLLLDHAAYSPAQIASALATSFDWTAGQIADFLKNGLGLARDTVSSALSAIGKTATDVADAVNSVFDRISPTRWL